MGTNRGGRPAQGEPVLDRVNALLRAFTAEHPKLTLTELARRSGLPVSTARRMALRLTQHGALERSADGRYAVGMQLWEIASLAPRGPALRQVALPYLEDLQAVTHHHVLLAVPAGDEAIIVERISGQQAVPVLYRVGGRMPLARTGAGLILLAHRDPEDQQRLIEIRPDARARQELRRTLAAVRREGVVIYRPDGPPGLVSVAAPIRDVNGGVVAALSIVVPDGATDPQRFTVAVRAAARGVSRHLGLQPPAPE